MLQNYSVWEYFWNDIYVLKFLRGKYLVTFLMNNINNTWYSVWQYLLWNRIPSATNIIHKKYKYVSPSAVQDINKCNLVQYYRKNTISIL